MDNRFGKNIFGSPGIPQKTKNGGHILKNDFEEKGLPVLLRPFRGSLDVGVWRMFKVKKRETQNLLGPSTLMK